MLARLGCAALAALAWASLTAAPVLAQSTATYTYDAQGRVLTATTAAGTTTYTYDNADNRIHVTSGNPHGPQAVNDTATVAYQGSATIPVLGNDTDPDGYTLSVSAVGSAPKGTTAIASGGTAVTYTAGAGQTGTDSFSYTASDGHGGTATATVAVTIVQAPVAQPISMSVAYNSSSNSAPLAFTGGLPSSVNVTTAPGHGTASVSGIGISYTPASGYSGPDSFSYTGTNLAGTSAPALANVTVNAAGCTTPPSANNSTATVAYNSSGNSLSPSISGTYASLSIASGPSHGAATVSGSGFAYTPTTGYTGSDSFTFNAINGSCTSNTATYSITVSPPPPPVTFDFTSQVPYNSSNTQLPLSMSGVVDSVSVVTNPTNGTATASGTTISYTPNTGWSGSDTFTYRATNAGGSSTPSTATVITQVPPPTAAPTSMTVPYNGAGNVTLLPGGNYTSVSIATSGAHGVANIAGGIIASYSPNTNYIGTDTFYYYAIGPGGSSPAAAVSVTVVAPARPTAGNVSASVGYNSSGNLITLQPGGDWDTVSKATDPAHGTVTVDSGAATATYTPTAGYYGADSFTYRAKGPGGISLSDGTVSITVASPAAPTAGNVSLSVPYNSPGSVGLSPGGTWTSLSIVSAPAHGSASINGTTATYTPNSGSTGSDSFTYKATGPGGSSAPGTVSVSIGSPPAPVASNTSQTVSYNTALAFTLPISGTYSNVYVAAGPSHGSVSLSGTSATYTPTSGYFGSDSFTFYANGAGGMSNIATASLTIQGPPALTLIANSTSYFVTVNGTIYCCWSPSTTVVTASGGTGTGYTYQWEYVSGDTGMVISSSTSNSVRWTHTTPMTIGTTYTAVWRCKVTDSAGNVAYSPNISVNVDKEALHGG